MKLLPILLGLGLVACITAYSKKEEEEKFKEILSPAAEPSAPTRKRRPYTGRLPSGLHKRPQVVPLPAPRPSLPTYSLPLQEESKSKGDEDKKHQAFVSGEAPSAPRYTESSYSIQLEPYYRPDDSDKAQDNRHASGSASYPVHIPSPNSASYPVHIATPASQYPAPKVQVVAATVAPPTTKLPQIPPGGNIKSGYNHVTNTHIYVTSTSRPQPKPVSAKPQPQPKQLALRPIYLPNFPQHLQGFYPVQFLPNFHQAPQPQYQVQQQPSVKKQEKQEVHAQEEEKPAEEDEEEEDNDNKEEGKGYSKGSDKGSSEAQHKDREEGQHKESGEGQYKGREQGQYRGLEQGQYKGRGESQYRIRVETQYKGRDESHQKERDDEHNKGQSEEQDKEKDEEQDKDKDEDEEDENKGNSKEESNDHKAGGYGPQVSGYQVHQTHEYRTQGFPAYRPQHQQQVQYKPASQPIAAALRPQPIQAYQAQSQPQVTYNRAQIPVFQIHVQNLPTFKHHEGYRSQVQSFPLYAQQAHVVQAAQTQESKPQAPAQVAQGYHQQSVSSYQASVAPAYQQQSVASNYQGSGGSAYQQQSGGASYQIAAAAPAYQQQSVSKNQQSTHQQQSVGVNYQASSAPAYNQQSVGANYQASSAPAYNQQSVGASYQTSSAPAYNQQSVSNYQVVSQSAQGYQSEEQKASEEEKSEAEGQQEVYLEDYSAIPGEGGRDYPQIFRIPSSRFTCVDKLPGYYADVELKCQVWHNCDTDRRKESFLCPNGTIYNQETFVCDWWYNVDCSKSEGFFRLNEELYKVPEKKKETVHAPQYEKKEQSSGYGSGNQYQTVQTSYQQISQPSYVVSLPSAIPPVAVTKHQAASGYGSSHSDSEETSSKKGSKSKKAEKQKPKEESEEDENHQSGY